MLRAKLSWQAQACRNSTITWLATPTDAQAHQSAYFRRRGEARPVGGSDPRVAQPSRVESLGLVMIEAGANRKPVIAADIEVSRTCGKSLLEGAGEPGSYVSCRAELVLSQASNIGLPTPTYSNPRASMSSLLKRLRPSSIKGERADGSEALMIVTEWDSFKKLDCTPRG